MATTDKITKTFEGCGTLIGLGVVLSIGWFALSYLLPDEWRIKYAMRYFTSYARVTVDARPTGCDFFRAPIGEKGCHYEKEVSTAEWSTSTTGHSIVSNDEGKTWREADAPLKTKLPTTFVFVEWNKIEDP